MWANGSTMVSVQLIDQDSFSARLPAPHATKQFSEILHPDWLLSTD